MKNVSRFEIINDLIRVSKIFNKNTVRKEDYEKYGKYSAWLVRNRFKTWNKALLAAGLNPTQFHNVSSDEYLQDIRIVMKENNLTTLSTKEYKKYGTYSVDAIQRRFGSWEEALKKIGVNLKQFHNVGNDLYIADIIKISNKIGIKKITQLDYNLNGGLYYSGVISKRFNGWHNALKSAGLINYGTIIINDDYFKELFSNLYSRLGRTPTIEDFDNYTRHNNSILYQHYPNLSFFDILKKFNIPIDSYYIGIDNLKYDSLKEMELANFLFNNNIKYESHKKVCKERRWTCDFYLTDYDLWLEYDGLDIYRNLISKGKSTFEDKIAFYTKHNYNFLILKKYHDFLDILKRIRNEK